MAVTLQQLIDKAVSIASRGTDPSTSPALSAEMVTEDLVSTVFNQVSQKMAGDPTRRSLLRRIKSISFSSGSGVVTEDVLTQYFNESMLYNTSDLTARYSLVPQWESFIRSSDTRLGYYCVNESAIAIIEPGATYSASTGLTGTRSLIVPCVVAVPATASTTISARDEVVDELLTGLADALLNPLYKFARVQGPTVRAN
jgi:hypothetical protein